MSSEPVSPPPPDAGGFTTAATAFLRGVVRLVVILLMGSLLGLGIYFGIPYLYNQFILPVEQNAQAIEQLQSSQDELEQFLAGQISDLQQRIQDLESQQDLTRETLSALQSAGGSLQDDLATVTAEFETQSEILSSLEADLTQSQQEFARLEQQLTRLATASRGQQQLLEELQSNGSPLREVQTELEILKTLQVLARARLFLGRSDIDLARAELVIAQRILGNLATQVTPEEADYFNRVLVRLGLAEQNLEETPLLAAEDVEISYQLLLDRIVPAIRSGISTPEGATPVSQTTGTTGTPPPASATPTSETPASATPALTPRPTSTPTATP